MDRLVERFLTKLGLEDQTAFESCCFAKLENIKEMNTIVATLECPSYLPYDAYRAFFAGIESLKERGVFISKITFDYREEAESVSALIDGYIERQNPEVTRFEIEDKRIIFSYSDPALEAEAENEVQALKRFLREINSSYEPICIYQETKGEDDGESNNEDDYDFYAELENSYRLEAINGKKALDAANAERERLAREAKAYRELRLKDIQDGMRVVVKAQIFKREEKVTRKNKTMVTIWYTDGTSAITSRLFEGTRHTLESLAPLQPGKNICVKGEVITDEYSNQQEIRISSFKLLEDDKPRTDEAEKKRVELHLHTKMSSMDGVSTVTEYIKTAKAMGHRALAITDHGVVQAFPEAQDSGKRSGLKIIYGAELYMVDSRLENAFNPAPIRLDQGRYVVFDLETTGLSSRYDRIIEFGAVKIEDGEIVDETDFFINPDLELSKLTTDLTGITNEMVRGGLGIKDAIAQIRRFIGDYILVSHNATFDVGFLNEALKNNGLPFIDNPIVDTLPLSRYMLPNQKSHTLGSVCRAFDVSYDESSAHRAIYDAQVLANLWMTMITILMSDHHGLEHKDLNDLSCRQIIFNTRPMHVTVYCKNQEGLKDLFKLISLSHVDYLGDVPRVPRELLLQNRKNLLIGSACFNGEVFQAMMTRSEEVVTRKMEFYDFIEVQPPENYSFLVNDGQVASAENIVRILRDLVACARRNGKMVCATGDVHYAEPRQKPFRDVYIFAKGLKGTRHPLNPYRRDRQPEYENPDQHYRTTTEMKEAFAFLDDPELIEEIVVTNPNKVVDMVEEVYPIKQDLYTPTIENCTEILTDMVYQKANAWYGDPLPTVIAERLEAELNGITGVGRKGKNYSVIYYIASQLVSRAQQDGYIVGSRGSVGSSLVATMASITEVNPLPPHYRCPKCKHLIWADPNVYHSGFDLPEKDCPECGTKMVHDGQNIPFATFLGFQAEKVPDIDLNFPSDYQARAHELTKELLGRDNVFKAGTIETVAEKTAIGYVKGYFEAKGIDPDSVRKAELERLALGCQDVKRTTGQHPGGIIVIPNYMSVYDFTPIQYPANVPEANWKTTHFDFHAIHDNVLKLDLLGHVDPYALRMMCDLTGVKVEDIPLNDSEVLALFSSTKSLHLKSDHLHQATGALGIPEFGTGFVRRILEETRPKSFADLLIISGLSHGTDVYNGNAQDLINSGVATLRDVIGCRDDIMTGLADKYGIDPADSFKIMELVRKNNFTKPKFAEDRAKYTELMKKHGVPEYYIDSCCKIKYLFPKAHAVAYCMMGVRVGWFKVHHPLAYYATYFTARCDAYDLETMVGGSARIARKLAEFAEKKQKKAKLDNKEAAIESTLTIAMEMADRGYSFKPISIKKSDATRFVIDEDEKALIPPFSAVEGLGESAAQSVVDARTVRPFASIEDLAERTRLSAMKISELKAMGALEGLHESEQMTLDDLFNL